VRSWAAPAAANNAKWCDLVCRTHGISAGHDAVAWASRRRTPALYPDAVTLVPNPAPANLLDRIDSSPGCSIKDSFASVDLKPYGFRVSFDAEWIVRVPAKSGPVTADLGWTVVREVDSFVAWEDAWRGEHGPSDVLRSDLIREPSVTVLGKEIDNRVAAGAILYRSGAVVGISNFFAEDRGSSVPWLGCLELATSLFPTETFVGYESGHALRGATKNGFDTAGPLRVWIREG